MDGERGGQSDSEVDKRTEGYCRMKADRQISGRTRKQKEVFKTVITDRYLMDRVTDWLTDK